MCVCVCVCVCVLQWKGWGKLPRSLHQCKDGTTLMHPEDYHYFWCGGGCHEGLESAPIPSSLLYLYQKQISREHLTCLCASLPYSHMSWVPLCTLTAWHLPEALTYKCSVVQVLLSSSDLALYINSYSNIIWVWGWWKIPLVYQYMDYTGHLTPRSLLPGPTTGVSYQSLFVPFKQDSLYLNHTHTHTRTHTWSFR